MKTFIVLLISLMCSVHLFAQLANSYPNDVGIENDPNVLYVDNFEDGMTNILKRYTYKANAEGMFLDSDVPSGSLGENSIKITSTGGENHGGNLYKAFTPGFEGTVYLRYYSKYSSLSKGYLHHVSTRFGGSNPVRFSPSAANDGVCGLGEW
ncbi:hypothetical protein KAJ27_00970 [bacterium]|nr:hypothetical protein [bacterium]